jgi:hypothetical protein
MNPPLHRRRSYEIAHARFHMKKSWIFADDIVDRNAARRRCARRRPSSSQTIHGSFQRSPDARGSDRDGSAV